LGPPSPLEGIKARSRYLRGTFVESLADPATGALRPDDAQLGKFHGFYQQDDRDERAMRQRQKLEPLYAFMLRICVPGGVLTPAQWLALDDLAERHGDGGLRITTRQAVQLHGVIKRDLRPTIASIHQAMLSTLAACGDVNRNVMGTPLADSPRLTATLARVVRDLSAALAPRTRAYHELWLDGDQVAVEATPGDEEPLYGPTYLPRKFKCAVALPPDNDVDVYTQDLGLVAIADGEELLGFDVLVGGGMGRSHGDDTTYPRLASDLGFCSPAQVVKVARAVLLAQRDLGNRSERHHARLKYTIDRLGLDRFRGEVEARQGFAFAPPRPFVLHSTLDRVGFFARGRATHLQLYLPCGRVRDGAAGPLRTALRELARAHQGDLRLTPNQNLLLSHIAPETRPAIEDIVARYQLLPKRSGLRHSSLACVALPTCGQAMAEAERYLPDLLSLLEGKLAELGLGDEPVVMRMTGCPNGCARPYAAEIGLVGRAPGLYELYLGGSRRGDRLARRVAQNLDEAAIVERLGDLFARWRTERGPDEALGDFCVRQGLVPAEEPSAS
jgi:sulfite reductase (NADPH) hemoprotein beta-component